MTDDVDKYLKHGISADIAGLQNPHQRYVLIDRRQQRPMGSGTHTLMSFGEQQQ